MSNLKIVLGNYPHTEPLKDGTIAINGVEPTFIERVPLHAAFAEMVRELDFDVSEMAIATFLQARAAGVPITLLPLVMIGSLHHHSITRWPESQPMVPGDLIGARVGVRAYSQTTGMWVRGILQEEYNVRSSDITWVTTEDPHVAQYVNPAYVERVNGTVPNLLRNGDVAAAVLGPPAMAKEGVKLVPIIPDSTAAGLAWAERHETIPVNHMVAVKTALLHDDPKSVQGVYRAIAESIVSTSSQRDDSPRGRVIGAGITDSLRKSIAIAVTYCVEQEMIPASFTVDEIFEDANLYL